MTLANHDGQWGTAISAASFKSPQNANGIATSATACASAARRHDIQS